MLANRPDALCPIHTLGLGSSYSSLAPLGARPAKPQAPWFANFAKPRPNESREFVSRLSRWQRGWFGSATPMSGFRCQSGTACGKMYTVDNIGRIRTEKRRDALCPICTMSTGKSGGFLVGALDGIPKAQRDKPATLASIGGILTIIGRRY